MEHLPVTEVAVTNPVEDVTVEGEVEVTNNALVVTVATTTTTPPPQATYVFTTQLYNEATGRELSTSQCSRETADGEPYDNVPYATYSLLDSTRNIIGIMKPVGNVGDCTFEYELTTGEVSDLLLIQGPRMQQNGFPASEDDWYEREDGAIVIAELSLGVTP